jgi:hypothetical protein
MRRRVPRTPGEMHAAVWGTRLYFLEVEGRSSRAISTAPPAVTSPGHAAEWKRKLAALAQAPNGGTRRDQRP